jgi:hypothetical protein
MAAMIETNRIDGSTNASNGSRSQGEFWLRNRPGIGEYGIEAMFSSAHAHGGLLSGGCQTSRQIRSSFEL